MNARISQLHKTEAGWLEVQAQYEAHNGVFIPNAGELIVYDPDDCYAYARLKIGDGATALQNLPFLADTVLAMQDDQRIAAEHKAWARSVPIFSDLDSEGCNNRNAYAVKNHPQVINALIESLHQEFPLAKERKYESVREKLKVMPQEIRRNFRRISQKNQER
jgi:hypothetical protein